MSVRAFPENLTSDDFIVRWTKVFFIVFITGLFAVILLGVSVFLIINRISNNIFEEIGTISFIFGISLLILFGLICAGGFISSLKNWFNPFKRFVATKEGLFLNINLKQDSAFFLPWQDISSIEKGTIKRAYSNGATAYVDSLSIRLKTNLEYSFPKIMRGTEDSSEQEVQMAKDTLDMDLDIIIDKLNEMKNN